MSLVLLEIYLVDLRVWKLSNQSWYITHKYLTGFDTQPFSSSTFALKTNKHPNHPADLDIPCSPNGPDRTPRNPHHIAKTRQSPNLSHPKIISNHNPALRTRNFITIREPQRASQCHQSDKTNQTTRLNQVRDHKMKKRRKRWTQPGMSALELFPFIHTFLTFFAKPRNNSANYPRSMVFVVPASFPTRFHRFFT